MIKEFVQAWDARKDNLATWFRGTPQGNLSYEVILKAIIDEVLNPFLETKWDSEKIHTIDDGDYQGCQLFVVPEDTYQPSPYEYFITYQDYGSCSGCDLLEGIRGYDYEYPTEEQIKEYMMLALHLLQRCKYFMDYETEKSIKPPVPEPLKLTWQDMKRIFDIHQVMFEEEVEAQENGQGLIHVTEEEYYKDLTKRFNNGECA